MKTILLHGLGQTPQSWQQVIKLTRSEVECPALFDLVHSIDYQSLVSSLEMRYGAATGPLRLCGLSLGAVLALDLALRRPDKVTSLVLIAGRSRSPTLLIDIQNLIFHCLPEKAFQATGLSKRDTIQLAYSMRRLDFRRRLHQITCPVTVVCGKRDRANLRAAKELTVLLPRAELHVIPSAGHEVDRDAPEVIARILDQ